MTMNSTTPSATTAGRRPVLSGQDTAWGAEKEAFMSNTH